MFSSSIALLHGVSRATACPEQHAKSNRRSTVSRSGFNFDPEILAGLSLLQIGDVCLVAVQAIFCEIFLVSWLVTYLLQR